MADERRCGAPKKSGAPCQMILHWGGHGLHCKVHKGANPAAEAAFLLGWELGQESMSYYKERCAKADERYLAEAEAQRQVKVETSSAFRYRDSLGRQLVEIGKYAYAWEGDDLEVGDRVLVPLNWVLKAQGYTAPVPSVVTGIGTLYQGSVVALVGLAHV